MAIFYACIVILQLFQFQLSFKLNTGTVNGNPQIYPNSQNVFAEYMTVDVGAQIFYQYFESMNKSMENNLIIYFGNDLIGTPQKTAY